MSFSTRPKPSREIAIVYNSRVLAEHQRKKRPYTSINMTKWFCNIKKLDHMLQNGWKPIRKPLNWKFYHNRRIHQILPHPSITCSDRWHTAWLSSTFILMKMPKKWVNSWLASKDVLFFRPGIKMLPEKLKNVVANDGRYFQWHVSY